MKLPGAVYAVLGGGQPHCMCVCVCSFFEDTNGRIIPVRKYLVVPPTGHLGNLEGEQPHLGDLFTMFINYTKSKWDDPPRSHHVSMNFQPRRPKYLDFFVQKSPVLGQIYIDGKLRDSLPVRVEV